MLTFHDDITGTHITADSPDEFREALRFHYETFHTEVTLDPHPLACPEIPDGSINPAPTPLSDQISDDVGFGAQYTTFKVDPVDPLWPNEIVERATAPAECEPNQSFTSLNVATLDAVWGAEPTQQQSTSKQPWPSHVGWVNFDSADAPLDPTESNLKAGDELRNLPRQQSTYPPRPSLDYVWVEYNDGRDSGWVHKSQVPGAEPNYIQQAANSQKCPDPSNNSMCEKFRKERDQAKEEARQLNNQNKDLLDHFRSVAGHRDILETELKGFLNLARKHGWNGDNDQHANALEAMTYWLDSFVKISQDHLELQKQSNMHREALQKVSAERTALHEELDQAHKNLNGAQARIDEWITGYEVLRVRFGNIGNRLGEERKKSQALRDEISRLKNPHHNDPKFQAELKARKKSLREDTEAVALYQPKPCGLDPMHPQTIPNPMYKKRTKYGWND